MANNANRELRVADVDSPVLIEIMRFVLIQVNLQGLEFILIY